MISDKEIQSVVENFVKVEAATPRNEDEDVYCFYKKEIVAFLTSFAGILLEKQNK